jgi:hypothetical protein
MLCLADEVDEETFEQLSPEARTRLRPTLGWLALEPVLGWQFGAFCDVAPIRRLTPRSRRPFTPLDPDRIDFDGRAPVTSVSCGESGLYIAWFGKWFPSEIYLQQATRQLARSPWSMPAREWAGGASFDDDTYVVLTPETIDADLAELAAASSRPNVFYRAWDTPHDVTFRTAILATYGLDTGEVAPGPDEFGLKLERLLARPTNEPSR